MPSSARQLHADRRKNPEKGLVQNQHGTYVSAAKSRQAKKGPLAEWRKAAQEHGYLQSGEYRALPKKGTAAYKKIKATYEGRK